MIDPRWRNVRNVLAIRLDNLGDVLVTTPAIHAVRASLPAARITLLASPVGAQAGRLNPDLDDVILYEAPWMDPWRKLPQEPARELAMVERLRRERFDAAIVFGSFRQSPLPAAYLCYLAGVPLRLAASIDGPGSLLTTRHKHPERTMHEVERGLDLVAAVGFTTDERDLVLKVPDDARARVMGGGLWVTGKRRAELPTHNPPPRTHHPRPRVVLHPGCSMPARTYPWEGFAAVAERLVERLGAMVVVTGGESERALVSQVVGAVAPAARRDVVPCAGGLAFADFCALIDAADLVVTNNTGPMHVAAAVKTPVVALFALTNPPEQWGPWRVAHRLLYHEVPCRLCYSRVCPTTHDCLRLITPDDVVAAASELLRDSGTTARDDRPLLAAGMAR